MKMVYDINKYINELNIDTFYRWENIDDRKKLKNFMNDNDWFDVVPIFIKPNKKDIREHSFSLNIEQWIEIEEYIEIWLKLYKRNFKDKINILLCLIRNNGRKKTAQWLREYLELYDLFDKSRYTYIYAIAFQLDKEINELYSNELKEFISLLTNSCPIKYVNDFLHFIHYLNKKSVIRKKIDYKCDSKKMIEVNTNAYSINDFAIMAYCVFNEEYWKKQNMINKAIDNEKYAELWLFISIHFISNLRGTDICRIPLPEINLAEINFFDLVITGKFSNCLVDQIIKDVRTSLDYKRRKPHKKEGIYGTPYIKLFIPESLNYPIALMLGLVKTHHDILRIKLQKKR